MKRTIPAVELTTALELTVEEENLLDMHSVLNVCNVVLLELLNIGHASGSPPELRQAETQVSRVARNLGDPEQASAAIENIEGLIRTVESAVDAAIGRVPGLESTAGIVESRANLESIFDILRVRAREIAARSKDPGGRIEAALYSGNGKLSFVVEDSGRGIPPDEITDLVAFGAGGANVADRPTRGGGFGLTKAYYVTRRFAGRMWVAGELDRGTRIEIRIPDGG
jgi:K+-sensing histidine kinase KdpD